MKKCKYEIREVEALNYGEEGWIFNQTWHTGEMITGAENTKRAFAAWLRHHGITFKPNRTLIEYDGDCYTIIDRKTKEPLFIAIPTY